MSKIFLYVFMAKNKERFKFYNLIRIIFTGLFLIALFRGFSRSDVYADDGLPKRLTSPKDQSEMVLVPEGKFIFGMNRDEMTTIVTKTLKEKIVSFYLTELPRQTRVLKAFYIDRFEVTNEKYARFLKETGHHTPKYWSFPQFNAAKQPVVGVGWGDAERYCNWANKRLPTEEEWEKAARGGDGRIWPWGNVADSARFNGVKQGFYSSVNIGSFPVGDSPYGVSDMAGNVWEMTSSKWETEGSKKKAMKGGSFLNTNADVRTSVRWAAQDEEQGANWLGFRCVMDVNQIPKDQSKK